MIRTDTKQSRRPCPKKIAEVCRHALREVDLIGRIGGEEFAILLHETGKDEANEVAIRSFVRIFNAKNPMAHTNCAEIVPHEGLLLRDLCRGNPPIFN